MSPAGFMFHALDKLLLKLFSRYVLSAFLLMSCCKSSLVLIIIKDKCCHATYYSLKDHIAVQKAGSPIYSLISTWSSEHNSSEQEDSKFCTTNKLWLTLPKTVFCVKNIEYWSRVPKCVKSFHAIELTFIEYLGNSYFWRLATINNLHFLSKRILNNYHAKILFCLLNTQVLYQAA